jgi:hypothetical protein
MNALRMALGWLCYQAVMVLPVRLNNRAYLWALGWAGYYAHTPAHWVGGNDAS